MTRLRMSAILLSAGVLALAAALACAAPAAEKADKAPADSPVVGVPDKLPANLGTKDQELGRLAWQSLVAALVILVLGGAGFVLSKRLMPRIAAARGKRILLVESFHLGPQKAVHLLQVGRRSLLVGGSRDRLTLLADVTDALPPPEIDLGAAKPRAKFVLPSLSGEEGGASGVQANDR